MIELWTENLSDLHIGSTKTHMSDTRRTKPKIKVETLLALVIDIYIDIDIDIDIDVDYHQSCGSASFAHTFSFR